jgi:hypothetical protein
MVRYIEHFLKIVGEDKWFVFVTKDQEINTNITIFVLSCLLHANVTVRPPFVFRTIFSAEE